MSSERVAHALANDVDRFLAHDVPVFEQTADQLVLLLALAKGGSFRTVTPSTHTRTQVALIPAFLPVAISVEEDGSVAMIAVAARD